MGFCKLKPIRDYVTFLQGIENPMQLKVQTEEISSIVGTLLYLSLVVGFLRDESFEDRTLLMS
jgi:hypothetical protein